MKSILGPAAKRLAMTFTDHDAYRRFWREHPAFANAWSPAVERYVDYVYSRYRAGRGMTDEEVVA